MTARRDQRSSLGESGASVAQADELAGQIRPVERVSEEEAQRGHGAIHRPGVHPKLRLMDLELANVLGRGGVRRATEECGEAGDDADVMVTGPLRKPAHRHVLYETLAQRTACGRRGRLVHSRLLLVEGSHHVQSRPPARSTQTIYWVSFDTVTASTISREAGSFFGHNAPILATQRSRPAPPKRTYPPVPLMPEMVERRRRLLDFGRMGPQEVHKRRDGGADLVANGSVTNDTVLTDNLARNRNSSASGLHDRCADIFHHLA